MAHLPASVPYGTVTGRYYKPDGSNATGTVHFYLLNEIEVPSTADAVIIPLMTKVAVNNGVLNVELPAAFYNVHVQLADWYEKNITVEVKSGVALNLPDAIGVVPPQELLTPVRTVNGIGPDASGNIQVSGGGGAVSSVFGRTGAVVAQSGDYTKAQVGLSNVDNTSDANKPVSTATQAALDTKEASGAAAAAVSAHVALPDPHVQYALEASLAAVATSGQYSDLSGTPSIPTASSATPSPVDDIGAAGVATTYSRSDHVHSNNLKVRHEYIKSGNVTLPNSSGSWAFAGGTNGLPADFELSIPAAVGDWVECSYNGMKSNTSSAFLDIGVVVGSTIARFLGSGTSTGLIEGDPGWYPVTGFTPHSGVRGFVVEAGDLDNGNVRFSVVNKTSGSGTLYASNDYPFYWHVKNTGQVNVA